MFSVVIPLYNKCSCIGKTLQSVFDQTFTEYEIIVVDDGSTDHSLDIVRQFDDPRIRIYTKENGGVSSARNYGIRLAKEKYIAFLDADDLWFPGFLAEMCRLINSYPGCGLYSAGYRLQKTHRSIYYAYHTEGVIGDYFKAYFESKTPFCNASCAVIPSMVFDAVGYFPEKLNSGEDLYLWIAVAKKYKVCVTPDILMSYEYQQSNYRDRIKKNFFIQYDLFKELLDPDISYLNEVIAFWVIEDAIQQALLNNKHLSKRVEVDYNYTQLNRKRLAFLRFLNRSPYVVIWTIRKGWRMGSVIKTYLFGRLGK